MLPKEKLQRWQAGLLAEYKIDKVFGHVEIINNINQQVNKFLQAINKIHKNIIEVPIKRNPHSVNDVELQTVLNTMLTKEWQLEFDEIKTMLQHEHFLQIKENNDLSYIEYTGASKAHLVKFYEKMIEFSLAVNDSEDTCLKNISNKKFALEKYKVKTLLPQLGQLNNILILVNCNENIKLLRRQYSEDRLKAAVDFSADKYADQIEQEIIAHNNALIDRIMKNLGLSQNDPNAVEKRLDEIKKQVTDVDGVLREITLLAVCIDKAKQLYELEKKNQEAEKKANDEEQKQLADAKALKIIQIFTVLKQQSSLEQLISSNQPTFDVLLSLHQKTFPDSRKTQKKNSQQVTHDIKYNLKKAKLSRKKYQRLFAFRASFSIAAAFFASLVLTAVGLLLFPLWGLL